MNPGEYSPKTYANLAIAYFHVKLINDAVNTLREGLKHYPNDGDLIELTKDPRFREYFA